MTTRTLMESVIQQILTGHYYLALPQKMAEKQDFKFILLL